VSGTIVVGGGLAGLARGYALARRGVDVRVIETSQRPGGVVRTEHSGEFLLELGPNTVRPTREIWDLIGELGLSDAALLSSPSLPRFIEFQERLHALAPGPQTLLTTRLLSISGKLRLLREPFVGARDDPRESVADFFARRLGPQVADRLVGPFVSGIWAGDAHALSARSAFPLLARWEREHGSLLRGALASRPPRDRSRSPLPKGLLSFRDGLETLPRALAASLGARLSLGAPVRRLSPDGGRWRVETEQETLAADRVVVAAPAAEAARLLENVDPEAARALSEMPQPPLAVLHLAWPAAAFPTPLLGFGHLVVPTGKRRILGAVWNSCLFPGRAPEGEVLVTAFAGGSRDPSAAALADARLLDLATRELSASLGARSAARLIRVTRYARAIPQYDLDHESRLAALEQAELRNPGLTFIGNYRGGISVGDVVRNGLAVSDLDS
jgi:oxygen-dependent protoporphyrinogen oxidase